MTQINEVAARLIELCTQGKFIEAQQELYDMGIIHIELDGSTYEGLETMLTREKEFLATVHSINEVNFSLPQFAGTYFSVHLEMKVNFKDKGAKTLTEICVYKVQDGKVIFEQFFGSQK